MRPVIWKLRLCGNSEPVCFAAEEFARLIRRMDPECAVETAESPYTEEKDVLWIGLDPRMPQPPAVEDPEADDAVYIHVEHCRGVITGSNGRSVLLAVYRFFREAGCVFLKPGPDGESVPHAESAALSVRVAEKAAYRHRGICLEGSNSYENAAEVIEFAPKLGFNAFFTQLFRPSFAFRRWYEHQNNPFLEGKPLANETIDEFVARYDREVTRRGLDHHRIGHGWATKVLGITSSAWHEQNDESEADPRYRELIAEIGGERKLYKGSGIDTNLCYSDPRAQELLAKEVVAYAKAHPDVRYLHFWLADQLNNQCECSRCQTARPSDFYVDILNRIDEGLTEAGLSTKIVFLIYLDLLWEPSRAVIQNPGRFVMMFAPIRRSYSVPMASDTERKQIPYRRNRFRNPPEAGGALPYLKAWQQQFRGDSFIFDYHYMWDYICDPGCWESLKILSKDVEDFRALGLNGFMSCQNLRVYLPSGLGMYLMAQTLWTGRDDFDRESERYLRAAYGSQWQLCRDYLAEVSALFDPRVLRGEAPVKAEGSALRYARIPGFIDGFLAGLEEDPVCRGNLECIRHHARLCRHLAAVLVCAAEGDLAEMDRRWQQARDFACQNEETFQRELDVFELLLVWESKILPRFRQQAEGFIE